MKWYSVKKYKPPVDGNRYLVFAENEIYIAFCEDLYWMNYESGTLISEVTHFCIPDPIEVEE